MNRQNLTKWLQTELQLAGLEVSLSDSIAEKGFVGDPRWVEIGWRAAIRYTGKVEIPKEKFCGLKRFGELILLIEWWHKWVSSQKIEVLSVA